jgi:thioredoxin reductase (NADPH)
MIVRRGELRASRIMQERVKTLPNIEILWHTETVEVLGDHQVSGVRVKDVRNGQLRDLEVEGFFVAIGHQPNTSVFNGQLRMDEQGYILTEKGSTRTNVNGVFACGDAQDKVYRQAITAAGTGCMAALDAERYLAEKGLH